MYTLKLLHLGKCSTKHMPDLKKRLAQHLLEILTFATTCLEKKKLGFHQLQASHRETNTWSEIIPEILGLFSKVNEWIS